MAENETTSLKTFHVLKKKNLYYVYNPKLILKGKYKSYKAAVQSISRINNCGHMIVAHNDNGTIREIIRSSTVKRLLFTDNGKLPLRTTRKEAIKLNEN